MKKIKLESVFNEFTLMGIAVSGAFYLGEYWEGIAVILFYGSNTKLYTKHAATSKHYWMYVPKQPL